MDEMEFTASNFMPRDLEIICILERVEKKRNYFTHVTKFPAKNG